MANFTEQAIKQAFIKLLEKQPLTKISVKNIVEECGINRNSFYYHFQDIPQLVESIVTEQANKLISAYPSFNSLEECFRVAFHFGLKNKKAIMNIYNSVNKDYFVNAALLTCEKTVTNYVNTAFPDMKSDVNDAAAIIKVLKCLLFGLIIDWINSGMPDDALDDMENVIEFSKDIPAAIVAKSKNF